MIRIAITTMRWYKKIPMTPKGHWKNPGKGLYMLNDYFTIMNYSTEGGKNLLSPLCR